MNDICKTSLNKKQKIMKNILILSFIFVSAFTQAQRFNKKNNQMEMVMAAGYNFSSVSSTLSYKHNYRSSAFFGEANIDMQLGGDNNIGSTLFAASYLAGFSLLEIINESMGLVPLDISIASGVGSGYENIAYKSAYEGSDIGSKGKFVYGIKGKIEIEYIITQRVGLLFHYGLLYPINSDMNNKLISFINFGISYKF